VSGRNLGVLAVVTAVVLGAAIWLSANRAAQRSATADGPLFADLKAKLGDVTEIRLSKGDGSKATLKRADAGWIVVERGYPADAQRVRELALNLATLEIVERKTSDPANYPTLGVESPDKPTATSTLVEVVAGDKTWSLIVGKPAQGRAVYVREPAADASALAQPLLTVDPDSKRWIDRQIADIAAAEVHDVAITPTKGAAYTLTKAQRTDPEFTLAPVPKGREAATSFTLNAVADALTAFNFDDVRKLPEPAPTMTHRAVYRTFDGQVLQIDGRREGDKAFVTVTARRDAALAARFPAEKAAAPATPTAPAEPQASAKTVERLATRAAGLEFEIPGYKFDSIFKSQEDLLEPKPEPKK
jgi:hypothetical protein